MRSSSANTESREGERARAISPSFVRSSSVRDIGSPNYIPTIDEALDSPLGYPNRHRRNLFWVSLGGSSPTANRKLEDRAQSPEMPIRPNNYLPLTICRTDSWQADVLDTEPSVVTKTEHEFSVSDIVASRHGKLS